MKGVVYQMFKTGEPGFSVNLGDQVNETLRNACTEVTSEDDSDVCNLGSINLARVTSLEEMRQITRLGTLFLLAGTAYSDVPYEKVRAVRYLNRRLGLGLMGLHEFLAVRGLKYEPSKWLGEYLVEYANSGEYARKYAIQHGLSVPVATRAIAPTGTIAIVAETTTGIEPIFCVAYKRRYLDAGKVWKFQYVIDPTARKLVEQGVDPEAIEDAYTLSMDMARRVRFQAWLQTFVDMSISSTINMPAWGTPANDESMLAEYERILIQYLPKIRGITVYPDGARGGQPLSPVSYSVAAGNEGVVFEESDERCLGGVCGS
jgi:ribonucleoside-diphosphate reductase alpha chain